MHIEEEDLKKYHQGLLEPEKLLDLLEHTKTCSYCADRLMNIEDKDIMKAPAYLKENLIKRTKMLDVKAEVQIKITSKKVQLLMYSLKTTAVLGALLLLFSVSNMKTTEYIENRNQMEATSNFSNQLLEKSNYVVNIMNDFSNQIVNGGMNR
jgi:hypothetical protein